MSPDLNHLSLFICNTCTSLNYVVMNNTSRLSCRTWYLFLCPIFFTDRAHGNEFSTQFEDSCRRMEDAVEALQKKQAGEKDVLQLLHISEHFYDQQYREARIVANVSYLALSSTEVVSLVTGVVFDSCRPTASAVCTLLDTFPLNCLLYVS